MKDCSLFPPAILLFEYSSQITNDELEEFLSYKIQTKSKNIWRFFKKHMLQQVGKIVLITLIAVVFVSCAGSPTESKGDSLEKPLPNEMSVKRSLLEKFPLTIAVPLKAEKSFISNSDEILVFPISLTVSDDDQIYVSDNNGQAIYKVSSDLETITKVSKEKTEQDEENLKYPNTIRFYHNKIFVADNDGIKVFKQNGELEKLIRCYYSINDFSIDSEGNFFTNVNFPSGNQENSLVIKLNENGARVSGIGQRPNPSENSNLEGTAYVEVKEQSVIVAYKHFPLVQVYNTNNGDLIREFEIKQPLFDELKKLKDNKEFVHPKAGVVVLPRYFAGVKVLENRIYLLLHLPNPEIVEVDLQGKELNRYRSDAITAMNYFGFDVRLVDHARQFIVGVIEPSRMPTIVAFNQNAEIQTNKK